ncbi:phospho-N-acetylmuramoyl-pentapeptide-transferase, partial [Nonlabens mediterrranea]|nr:phospho-N-acetylmuramoyl-pentapeptide-transferase [Nonlabens mediterrranea]
MLYYLFKYLEEQFQFPGASLFGFITFRAAIAFLLSLGVSTVYGKRIIKFHQPADV